MKKFLSLLLVVMLTVSLAACGSTDATSGAGLEESATSYFAEFPGNRIVGWDTLFSKIDAGDEPFILSIRQADVYNEGHIVGAVNAAWGEDLASKVSMLPTDQPVYVYCYSGQTAGQTVALLNVLGIEAYSVKSGFNNGATKVEGYEAYVSTEAVELTDAGADFDEEALTFVQNYFNSVQDNGNFIVSSADALTLADSGDAVIVDIRSAEDFEAGHIEGAINLPYGANMQEGFADLPEDTKLIVTCYSGQTAGQTVGILRSLGYDAVSLKSGMNFGYKPSVINAAASSYFENFEGSNIVSAESVFEKIEAGETPYILSIRQAKDYEAGHIVGAVNAAWGTDLASKVSMLPTDQPVYVYCYSGQTAGQTIALLRMLGVEAYSIKSGMNAIDQEANAAYISTEAVEMSNANASFDPFVLASVVSYFEAIPESGSNIMASADVLAGVEAGELTVVDIRRAEDFEAGHIEGAINLPYGQGMQEGFADLPAGKLVVTCYSGQTAGQTVAVMRQMGYDVVSLKSGMSLGWIPGEFPVVTN